MPSNRTKYRVVPAYPEPYKRKPRKRGRPKKNGRPKKDRWQEIRASPSKRTGSRFRSLSFSEDTYHRLREMALGGVTRHMLREMTIPVLLSH